MEVAGKCGACGEARMVLDEVYGVVACDACGRVGDQMEMDLRSEYQTGHVIERRGTFVSDRDTGAGAARSLMGGKGSYTFGEAQVQWMERARADTMKKVESITALLRVPGAIVDQAKHLLESAIDKDWGTGRWVDILVAACVYIVIRQSQLPLTVPEVADCVNCDVVELGRMFNRVIHKLEIVLPTVDTCVFFERAASTLPALRKSRKEEVRKLTKQGSILLDYAQEWFICTGRRPLPIVAATFMLVLESNKVAFELSDVARELHAGLWATKRRLRELKTALVGIAQKLPWGRDITPKTVLRHLPFILKYLEMKMKLDKKQKEALSSGTPSSPALGKGPTTCVKSLDCHQPLVAPCTSDATCQEGNQRSGNSARELSSSKRALECQSSDPKEKDTSIGNISGEYKAPSTPIQDHEEIASTNGRPSKLLKTTEHPCASREQSQADISQRGSIMGAEQSSCHWADEGSVGKVYATLEQASRSQDNTAPPGLGRALKDPVKWEALPMAFTASFEARMRRRQRINSAKSRIAEARHELAIQFPKSVGLQGPVHRVQAQPRQDADTCLDKEDLIIEHFLLCGASEPELENGYYRSLLAIYPMDKNADVDDDPANYVRSRSEVEFLLQIREQSEGSRKEIGI